MKYIIAVAILLAANIYMLPSALDKANASKDNVVQLHKLELQDY